MQINLAQHFLLDSVFCNNLKGTSTSTGVCLNLVGGTGGASTQYGVVVNLGTTNTRFPVQTVGKTSSVNLFGGDIECNLATAGTGSVGMDIGLNHGNGIADHNGGEWGVFGTHILNCDTAIGLVDSNAFQDYAILEQTTGTYLNTGTGVSISTVFSPTHTVGTVVAGNMISFSTGVSLGSGVDPITISTTFANFAGGTKISGSSNNSIVLSPTIASNLPVGLSLGIPGPTAGTTGTLIFANSTTANTIQLTPAAPTASRTYTIPDGGGSSSIGLTAGTLTNGDYASWDANGNAKDSGTSAGPYSMPWITAPNNAATVTFSTTANTEKLWGVVLTYPLTTTQVTYNVNTQDNTANVYGLGILNSSGTVVLHIGPTAGSTLMTTAGNPHTVSWVEGSTTLQPGKYYLVVTTNCATACAVITGANTNTLSFLNSSLQAASSGGTVTAVTPPSDSYNFASFTPSWAVH